MLANLAAIAYLVAGVAFILLERAPKAASDTKSEAASETPQTPRKAGRRPPLFARR